MSNKTIKIALFGKMRSGKDTVGKMLIEELGFKRYAFGDGIGAIIAEYFPQDWAKGKPRGHYQLIGQTFRQLDEEVWINYLLNKVEQDGATRVVVTDGRQQNESKRLKEEGYVIVKVEAPEEIRIKRILESGDTWTPEQLNHETELQVDLITDCITIRNDRDLAYLRKQVEALVGVLDVLGGANNG